MKKISQYVAKKNLNQNADDEGMSSMFEFSICCFYCKAGVATKSIRNRKSVVTLNSTYNTKYPTRQKAVNFVKTKVFGETLKEILSKRKDKLGAEIEGRINMVSDLFSADALYHVDCDKRFKRFRASATCTKKKMEHLDGNEFGKYMLKEDSFLDVCDFFQQHENELLTVADLVMKM